VTGGFGFLGTHLLEEISEKTPGANVHVIDNFTTSPMGLEKTLESLSINLNLTYENCDLRDSQVIKEKKLIFDEIYHLASFVGPAGVLNHGGNMIRGIVQDGYQMIDYAVENSSRLLLASSSEVYGGGVNGLCSEDTARVVPAETTIRLEYAVGKIAIETALLNTGKMRNLSNTVIRPFNVAGPRQSGKGGFVLPRFITAAMEDRDLTVFGDGKARRAFTHVRDIANGCFLAMHHDSSGKVFNLGNPRNITTIGKFAENVVDLLKSNSKIVNVNPKTLYGDLYEEASEKFPDSRMTMELLNWNPNYSLEEIIVTTWDFMKTLDSEDFRTFSGK
jgi:UDP-glucose 4-epimerase